jgi:hypothetical protein
MIAGLTADLPCTIVAKDPPDRALEPGESTKWRWNVTPLVSGNLHLTATLTAPVIVDGKETGYTVTSFEETVTVNVTYFQYGEDMLNWAKDYWVLLLATAGAVGGAWRWWWRKPKPHAGFKT